MTLNVNLEDVPWEILEAVRLRILAERRAMEQSRLQRRPIALRPQAQFAKLGARTDQRRLPEPAAILEKIPLSLIIYYPDEPPPQATVKGTGFTDLNQGLDYSVTTFQGVNALITTVDDLAGPYWSAKVPSSFTFNNDPFTIETWLRNGSSSPSLPITLAEIDIYFDETFVFGAWVRRGFDPRKPGVHALFNEDEFYDETTLAEISDFEHICFQRINSTTFTFHRKGQLLKTWTASSPDLSGELKVEFYAVSGDASLNPGVGQIRLTNTALYGTRNFKPPTRPFFVPPQP
jgi:hypothetical protein